MSPPRKRTGLLSPAPPATFRRASMVYVAVEGDVAEKNYFEAVRPIIRGRRLREIIVLPPIANRSNVTRVLDRLFTGAENFNAAAGDQRWLVVDVDDGNNKHWQMHNVLREAEPLGIGVVISRPSFEVWICAHVEDPDVTQTDVDGYWKPRARHLCAGYAARDNPLAWLTREHIDAACVRMRTLRGTIQEDVPSTVRSDVDRLLTALIELSEGK